VNPLNRIGAALAAAIVLPLTDAGMAASGTTSVEHWGGVSAGQLCLGNGTQEPVPVRLPLSHVTALAGAGDHALDDSKGILRGPQEQQWRPGRWNDAAEPEARCCERFPTGTISSLEAAYNNSGALFSDGEYFDWGIDGQGQLGDGQMNVSSALPVHVVLPSPVRLVAQGGSESPNGRPRGHRTHAGRGGVLCDRDLLHRERCRDVLMIGAHADHLL
jgi:hypothetical protein